LSPVIVSILCKNNVRSTSQSSDGRALNLKFASHIPLPPLRKSDQVISFDNNDDQTLKKEKQSILLRKSVDTYSRSQDENEDDISSRILSSYDGRKSAKVIHSTRSVALQQPNVFVYLPSPISPIRDQQQTKQIVSIRSDDCPKKLVSFHDRIAPNREKAVTKGSTINPMPERDLVYMRKPFLHNRDIFSPLVPVTSKSERIQPVPTRDSVPVMQTSYANWNNLVGFQRLPPPVSPFLRTIPLMREKAIIITPPVPQKTISVYTTHYTPATKTVVYEAQHFPPRPTVQIFGIPSHPFPIPFHTRYQSESVPFVQTTNYIKPTFKTKIFGLPIRLNELTV